MVIFNSYVSLPEGIYSQQYSFHLNPFVHEQCRETTRKLSGLRAFNILGDGVCLKTTETVRNHGSPMVYSS